MKLISDSWKLISQSFVHTSVILTVETAGCSIPREICVAAMFLVFTSSLVNPIIYGIMNPQFKAAFKRVLMFGRRSNNQIGQGWTWSANNPGL